jgi:hypothetical protein
VPVARIERFGIGQTAKVLGVLYALMGLVFVPFFILIAMFSPSEANFGLGFAIMMPILYGIAGFVFTAVGCWLYNIVAGWVGGIEVDVGHSV